MSITDTSVALPRRLTLSSAETARINDHFAGVSSYEIIDWATERFGPRLMLTSSFADTVLIDLAIQVDPDIEVVFLDTGFHFSETLETLRQAMDRYSLHLTVLRPSSGSADVWANGSDACCASRKVAQLDEYLSTHADAWLSGLRRADALGRAQAPIVSLDRRGLVKINPLAEWSDEQIYDYIAKHDVLRNPLLDQGYPSIGCWPCTEIASDGRTGRWGDSEKTECGLHL